MRQVRNHVGGDEQVISVRRYLGVFRHGGAAFRETSFLPAFFSRIHDLYFIPVFGGILAGHPRRFGVRAAVLQSDLPGVDVHHAGAFNRTVVVNVARRLQDCPRRIQRHPAVRFFHALVDAGLHVVHVDVARGAQDDILARTVSH